MELRKEIIAAKIEEDMEKSPFDKDKTSDQERYQIAGTMEKYKGEIDQERKRNEKAKNNSKKLGEKERTKE